MRFPTFSLSDIGWAEIISIVTWFGTVIYISAILRADVAKLSQVSVDHESRIRAVEYIGSSSLKSHVELDNSRQDVTDKEVARLRQEVAQMRDLLIRVDTNVTMLLDRR